MAGSSMTFVYKPVTDGLGRNSNYARLACTFTSDSATGAATGTTDFAVVGRLIKVVTDPGSAAPTANWDVVLTDEFALDLSVHMDDVAIAALIARHTTANLETYLPLEDTAGTGRMGGFPLVCGPLTVAVANAGNSTTGIIYLYVHLV